MHDYTARRFAVVAAAIATLAAVSACALASPPTASSHIMACVAFAQQPDVYNGEAYAAGGFTNPCTHANWYYDISLKNNANSTLQEDTGYGSYGNQYDGSWHGCAGAIVHTFIWINDNGNVTSDSGITNNLCAY